MTTATDLPAANRDRNSSRAAASRLVNVDILRGLVMVIMALDHTRDFFSSAAFDPTDLARTSPQLFFTRWITHFCAPIFVLLSGAGASLSLTRGKSKMEVAKFLFSRGLWLIFLEIFVISPFGWSFSLSFGFTRLQVIWVIGVSMMVLSGLILLLPSRAIGGIGIAMIALHNLFDGAHAEWLGRMAGAWKIIHQLGFYQTWPHKIVASLYPLVPWVGVMMAGYAMGEVLQWEAARRRRVLLWTGTAMCALFMLLRAANVYGDPAPWSVQGDPVFTLMSFVRCTKYPPSLLYLLMTLGPGLFILAALDGAHGWVSQRLLDFGRVPLFYYLWHLPLLHAAAVGFSFVKYGRSDWLLQDSMAKGTVHPLPQGYGYGLMVVNAVWVGAVLVLYPACRWFGEIKRTRQGWIYRYL